MKIKKIEELFAFVISAIVSLLIFRITKNYIALSLISLVHGFIIFSFLFGGIEVDNSANYKAMSIVFFVISLLYIILFSTIFYSMRFSCIVIGILLVLIYLFSFYKLFVFLKK